MELLQKAYDARSKKINKLEKTKDLKNPQDVFDKLDEFARDGYDSIPDEDKKSCSTI